MGKDTSIAWTNHSFNPWQGCTEVSPGCDNCYARTLDTRWGGESHWGKGVARRVFGDHHWAEPLAWNRKAAAEGTIARVFCASVADVMDDEAPEGQRSRLWELIDKTPSLLWLLLTKRPQRYVRYLPTLGFKHPNVMLGATMESQPYYDLRMPHLHNAQQHLEMVNDLNAGNRARVLTFVSYEPAIGPLSIARYSGMIPDWLIFGGETGGSNAERRSCAVEWAENVKAECEARGVAFFMKQMSAQTTTTAAALIPAHMLIRQFPAVPR